MPAIDNQLGEFLRAQRSRVSPGDVGLPDVGGRRVKGLRREEVAVLAGVSADYYARLEQGRERAPSAQMVDAICNALRLGRDAREHAYRLARLAPVVRTSGAVISTELVQLVDAFPQAAAYVVNPAFRVLATNATARELLGPKQLGGDAVFYLFLDPEAHDYFVDWDVVARATVSGLRYAAGYQPPHPEMAPVIDRLLAESPSFVALWNDHEVTGLTITRKIIDHPQVGRLELSYQTLDVRDSPGQQLIVATAPVGSPSADALALLGTLAATRSVER